MRGWIYFVHLITIILNNNLTDFHANKSQKLCSWHFLSREIRLTQPLYKMQWICSNSFLKHGIYHQSFITKLGQTEYKQEEYICSFTKKALPKKQSAFYESSSSVHLFHASTSTVYLLWMYWHCQQQGSDIFCLPWTEKAKRIWDILPESENILCFTGCQCFNEA